MPKAFPLEFRRDVVAVARKGEAPLSQIAKDFGISESCLHRWLKLADVELRARADTGDRLAAERLAGLLADRGEIGEAEQILRAHADTGDKFAAMGLAGLLGERGEIGELRARVEADDGYA